MKECLSNNQRP